MWRWVVAAALVLAGGALYWASQAGAGHSAAADVPAPAAPTASPGSAAADPTPARPPLTAGPLPAFSRALPDPVLVTPCNVLPAAEQDVASQIDGTLEEVAVELGQPVRAGQVLARLDDRQLRPQVELLEIRAAGRAAERIARALHEEADAKVRFAERANRSGLQAVADVEYRTYLCQRERYAQELVKARDDRREAEKELEKVRAQLDLHAIRAAFAGEVVRVYKRRGEAVKQAEPLFRVASFGRLRVEGLCKVSQAGLLRVGMPAVVEPELRGEPLTTLRGHTAPVQDLVVSSDGRLLASASEDHTVIVWQWPAALRLAVLPHPGEVLAVAFVPAADGSPGPQALLTGSADGRVRYWTVGTSGQVEPPLVLDGAHEGAIRALAVSGDGRRLVTGGEDRRVGVWDLGGRRLHYWVQGEDGQPQAHQGAVTAVHFCADGGVLSAGRDNALHIWRLGQGHGRLVRRQTGRTGHVPHLGASADGRLLLFDHGEELRLLDRDDGAPLGTLQSARQGHFQGVAALSPSGRLVLTGANNGQLQLWKVPARPAAMAWLRQAYAQGFDRRALAPLGAYAGAAVGPAVPGILGASGPATLLPGPGAWEAGSGPAAPRLWGLDGYEVRRFVTANGTTTCAAFAADERVFFSGGTDKVVRAWSVPPPSEWEQPLEARVTFVANQVERGTDLVRIRAELDNPADPARRLRPGTFAGLRLYPETAAPRARE